jgi:hypothetical protein
VTYAKSQGTYLGNICTPSWTGLYTPVTLGLYVFKFIRLLKKLLESFKILNHWTETVDTSYRKGVISSMLF